MAIALDVRPSRGAGRSVSVIGGRRRGGRAFDGGDGFESQIAFTGIGYSRRIASTYEPCAGSAVEACALAIDDAGLPVNEIDGICAALDSGDAPADGVGIVERALGLDPSWRGAARRAPGPTGNIVDAAQAVASGICRHVLCFTAFASFEHARAGSSPRNGAGPSLDRVARDASRYLRRHGRGREALGWVAVAARRHAARNPDALRRSPLEIGDYLAADTISTPLTALDRYVSSDGAIAIVVSGGPAALGRANRPVWVDALQTSRMSARALGRATGGRLLGETSISGLWSHASLSREDVDFVAVDDSYTFNALRWLESLGFCAPGEAAKFVEGGTRIGPDGVLPMNPDGGHLANGHSNGYGNVHEAILQLRHQAETRQIPSVRVAAVASGTPDLGNAMLLCADD